MEANGAPETAEVQESVRVIVLSDIHATTSGDPFTNVAQSTANDASVNALVGARSHLASTIAAADLVVCPGDLVHEGRTEPMPWVWSELHGIANDLGAELIAAAGNHDLLLAPTGGNRPSDALRMLRPRFPYDELHRVERYWAHDYAIVESERWRVVSVNSSARLGGYDRQEADHGRFGRECGEELAARLAETNASPAVNVCVCHHHPQEWTEDSDRISNHMLEGDRLIELLDERGERWMLVHGHKHYPRLDYLGGTSRGPVRLASGSIGADLLGESGTKVRNQMHLIDFHPDAVGLGLMLAGHVMTFDWEPGIGWVEPPNGSELPGTSCFGYRRDGAELAQWLLERARARHQRTWTWDEIVMLEPRCAYLAHCDRREFFEGVRRLGGGVQEAVMEVTFSW